jgi:hypothetical protein
LPRADSDAMSSDATITAVDSSEDENVLCWCCAAVAPPDQMVHLQNHPEVHLYLRCAHFVHQQAWEIEDERTRGPGAFVRDKVRALRAEVQRRGWHENRFIGERLQWLGKYLP